MRTKAFLATLAFASVVIIAGCKKDDFTEIVGLCPLVVATNPEHGATGVPLDQIITITFNEVMDPATITAVNLTLQHSAVVSGDITYSGVTATFVPSSLLLPNTTYTGRVSTRVKDVRGNALQTDHVWSFSTGTTLAPLVIITDPASNESGVGLNKVITATFNTAMDSLSFTTNSFMVRKDGISIAGSVWYFNGRAYFTPTSPLISNTIYTAVLNRSIRNLSGTALGNDYVWTFSTVNTNPPTVVSTDPLNNATGVSPASSIRAIFSSPMDPSTLNTSTFNVRQNGNIVPGTVSYTGVTATFFPTNPLLANTSYSATITQAAKDLSGRPLTADHMWSFSTQISGQPAFVNLNSATRFGVFAGSGIINQAGFSEIHDMDLGIHPGNRSSVTGFPPGLVFNGFIYASNDILPAGTAAMLLQARSDLNTAYLFAKDAILPTPQAILGDQGGKTLLPGIYKSASNFLIANGNLRLDAQGDPNAVWIFQVGSDLTTVGSNGGSIILAGGARASNIFWQVGGTATVGDNSNFQGIVLAQSSVTMKSGATATGRMLSMNGAITLANSNIIRKP